MEIGAFRYNFFFSDRWHFLAFHGKNLVHQFKVKPHRTLPMDGLVNVKKTFHHEGKALMLSIVQIPQALNKW
jgi:hypothetical protein